MTRYQIKSAQETTETWLVQCTRGCVHEVSVTRRGDGWCAVVEDDGWFQTGLLAVATFAAWRFDSAVSIHGPGTTTRDALQREMGQ